MLKLGEVLREKTTLEIECVDRVYLNGYVKDLQMPGGLVNFIRTQLNWPIPSPQALGHMTEDFRKRVEQYAAQAGLKIIEFEKGEDKDVRAEAEIGRGPRKSGVVLIGKAQEKASAFKCRRSDRGTKVWFDYSRQSVFVTQYYFYIVDEDFGLCFIKVCTYLPFEVKVCFNGHAWAKRQSRKEGCGFEDLSNGFASSADPARLQEICYGLDEHKVQAFFDRWVEQLPWPLTSAQRAAGYAHRLSVWQMEVSLTQVFADREQGRRLVEQLIRENLDLGRPDRVSLLFERKVTKATRGEFRTRVIRKGVLPCIRIEYKNSGVKQYLKEGRALRTEFVMNNTYDFGMPRGLDQFTRIFELGRQVNRRLLEQEVLSQDSFLPLEKMRELTESTQPLTGQRAAGLRFGNLRVMALLEAVCQQTFTLGELRNKTIREKVAQLMGKPAREYTRAQMTYDLRRLRLKGLLERIPRSHQYSLTALGKRAATFFTKLYERLFLPGLASLVPQQTYPSDLAKALGRVENVLTTWMQNASVSITKA